MPQQVSDKSLVERVDEEEGRQSGGQEHDEVGDNSVSVRDGESCTDK